MRTTLEQIHAQVQALPEPLQQEVLDFVEYLHFKQAKPQPAGQNDAAWTQEMQEVLTELRQGAAGYSEAEIDQMIDEALATARAANAGPSNG